MAFAALAAGAAGLTTTALANHDLATDRLITTITKLTVLPDSAPGSFATLAAAEAAANGAHPAGWVQFQTGNTDIGGPVRVNSAGIATTTAAFLGVTQPAGLTAVFTPATSAYLTSATTAITHAAGGNGGNGGSVVITFTVPSHGNGGGNEGGNGGGNGGGNEGGNGGGNGGSEGAGDFRVTVQPSTVRLQDIGPGVAAGVLEAITVTDSRSEAPGWSVWGQASDFIGNRGAEPRTIPGTALGWVPTGSVARGASLGPSVNAGQPGLGGRAFLMARAAPASGLGTSTLSADLALEFPAGAVTNTYLGTLTITFIESGPLPDSSG